jgi:hypothetical protein
MRKLILLLLSVVLFSGCEKMAEYYFGFNKQPNISYDDFLPGLNVFGVLCYGPSLDSVNHHFEVQRMMFVRENIDSSEISDAKIQLVRKTLQNEVFEYTLDTIDAGIYANPEIVTAPGDEWSFRCTYDTFSVVSQCVIPNVPVVTSLKITNNHNLNVVLAADTSSYLYYLYLVGNEDVVASKIIPQRGYVTETALLADWDLSNSSSVLFIFACDKNLETYYTTSNTFFKPNAFREPYTTVDGGYGTFGAMSSVLCPVN